MTEIKHIHNWNTKSKILISNNETNTMVSIYLAWATGAPQQFIYEPEWCCILVPLLIDSFFWILVICSYFNVHNSFTFLFSFVFANLFSFCCSMPRIIIQNIRLNNNNQRSFTWNFPDKKHKLNTIKRIIKTNFLCRWFSVLFLYICIFFFFFFQ